MDEHPNAKLLHTLAAKMGSGDMTAVFDVLSDDVEWHEIGRSEPTRGKDAAVQRFTEGFPDVEFQASEHDAVANDEHGVQLMNVTVRRGDRTLNYRTAEIYHFKDGKITARWAFSDDTAAIMEFFS